MDQKQRGRDIKDGRETESQETVAQTLEEKHNRNTGGDEEIGQTQRRRDIVEGRETQSQGTVSQ